MSHGLAFRLRRRSRAALRPNARPYAYLGAALTLTRFPVLLRRIRYHDVQTSKTFNFLSNNFATLARTVADLYRYRWQVELFFKWIKQHLVCSVSREMPRKVIKGVDGENLGKPPHPEASSLNGQISSPPSSSMPESI